MDDNVPVTNTLETGYECCCTGIRFCARCCDSERVKRLFSGDASLQPADVVIAHQSKEERTSSCSFAIIGESTRSMCIECGIIFNASALIGKCSEHGDLTIAVPASIDGLYVFRNIVTSDEEQEIIDFLDHPSPFPAWKDSQSGRRKQEYGPRKNFKKRKVKPADIPAMPMALQTVFERISECTRDATKSPYIIAEASALEYTAAALSNFDPHIDDTWLWGDRIAGLSLLQDCAMTFVDSEGRAVDVYFPARCFFLMSGECRYHWMHGIRPERVKRRRISVTFRELSKEIMKDKEMATPILVAAANFA